MFRFRRRFLVCRILNSKRNDYNEDNRYLLVFYYGSFEIRQMNLDLILPFVTIMV
jgi:hypothetical protein